MRLAHVALAGLLAAAAGVHAQKPSCRERLRDLDERRADAIAALEDANRETAGLQKRTDELERERRENLNSNDRFLVADYNTRAQLHREKVEQHNGRVAALNAEADAVNRDIRAHRADCAK